MVRDCLEDDFRAFLEPRELVALGRHGAGAGHRRYSELRLPGRWPGHVFLHHDPLRKPSDRSYFRRCVERFRGVARDPRRKLLLLCCLVDSEGSRRSLLGGRGGPPEAPGEGADGAAAGAACSPGDALGSGASWRHSSPPEVLKLFEALQAYGVENFHLAAVTLCTKAASSAVGVPQVVCQTTATSSAAHASVGLHEVHLVPGHGSDADPFKFFGVAENEEAFIRAIFGERDVGCAFDLTMEPPLVGGYQVCGYREEPCQEAPPPDSAAVTTLSCRWCGCGGFTSRNRLFTHLRSTPSCAAAASAENAKALLGKANVGPVVLAFSVGYLGTRPEAAGRLARALAPISASPPEGAAAGDEPGETGGACPAVADVLLLRCSPAMIGEALLEYLKSSLGGLDAHLYGLTRCPSSQSCVDLQHSKTYGYLLPLGALSSSEAPAACEGAPSESIPERRRSVYRGFKAVLRHLRELLQQRWGGALDQLKMAERVILRGEEFVVVHLSGARLSELRCMQAIGASLCLQHQWLPVEDFLRMSATWSPVPEAPLRLLYLEECRMRHPEHRHCGLFGTSAEGKTSEGLPTSSWDSERQTWREALRKRLVERYESASKSLHLLEAWR